MHRPYPTLPAKAQTLAAPDALDFLHWRSARVGVPMTALEAWDLTIERPLPFLGLAFRMRDAISARFGVKRIGGLPSVRKAEPQVGDHLGFFLIEHIEPEVLSLSARDRHLDVLTCITSVAGNVSITSSVQTHNWFGRIYMLPVGLAHRLIVRAFLRRLERQSRGLA